MTNKLFCFILFAIIPFVSHAQKFNGGIVAGMSATEISGDRLTGPNKAGIYAGFYVNRYFSERSSIQMEIDFIQKGSRKNPDTLNWESYLLRINYVEIPVHYKFDFYERFTFETGLSYGVLITSYEEIDAIENPDKDPPFYTGDLSFNFGLFYSLAERLRLNIRYSNSILPVRPHSSGTTYQLNKGQYNEVLSFTLHYEL